MENCKYHPDRPAVRHCKVCGAPLCEECEKVDEKYLSCPRCAKKQLEFERANYKRGLNYLYMALVCLALDVVLFVIDLCVVKNPASQMTYMIVSIVFFVLFLPFCIWLLVRRKNSIKKISNLLTIAMREDDSKDRALAQDFLNKQNQKFGGQNEQKQSETEKQEKPTNDKK